MRLSPITVMTQNLVVAQRDKTVYDSGVKRSIMRPSILISSTEDVIYTKKFGFCFLTAGTNSSE